ncbi:MAG: YihY/virulence factor BrkB family protein [Rhodospirillaceae bacterium]
MRTNLTRIIQACRGAFAQTKRAAARFLRIDGPLFAAAFSHYAFLSLFPLIVVFVTVASGFIDRQRATTRIIRYVEQFVPIGLERKAYIFDIVAAVVTDREEAGILAFALLLWAGSRFLSTLVRATNRAWAGEAHDWWRLPIKGFLLLLVMTAAASLGVVIPAILRSTNLIPELDMAEWMSSAVSYGLRFAITFLGLTLFYKLAPRRRISFAEVWAPAAVTASLLQLLDIGFGLYLLKFASLSAVYGVFGSIVALLLWIYLWGCIFIFGACLCAVLSAERERMMTHVA